MPCIYNDFYGLKQAPFNITPDPHFLFFTERHREALNHMHFGISEGKGFVQVTGDVGSGKTTLCRAMLDGLGPEYKTALILDPYMTATQLLRTIVKELGLPKPSRQDRMHLREALDDFLLEQVATGNRVVLIIDEAQNLSLELLEQVRLLSNLETDEEKMLQIILLGQPELRDKLDDPRLRQLRQRITVRYHLESLASNDVDPYIRHRIQVSGGNGLPHFTRGAVRKIYRYSRGVPRLVNAVCDKALLCGYVAERDRLTRRHISRAIAELEGVA